VKQPQIVKIEDLQGLVGVDLEPSEWLLLTQQMFDSFADSTLDRQWIHTDPVRAASGPYGTTIAHGFLVLSLGPHLLRQVLDLSGLRAGINYGLNRVRFTAPAPVGSRLRLRVVIREVIAVNGGARVVIDYTFEKENGDRPVCIAEGISQFMFAE
jgi:acyl dehydratase